MNLDTITIDPDEARDRLAAYEQLLAAERTAEDTAIAAGYRAAARGLPVISMQGTITAGGFHDDGWPRLAVVRADALQCFVRWDAGDLVFAARDDWRANRGAMVGTSTVRVQVPGDDVPPGRRRGGIWTCASTIVPIIPPEHRPRRNRLRRRHVLWEVDQWTMVPPVDPVLIQHIRGDLWAVLAAWNLTRLERTVLMQRG